MSDDKLKLYLPGELDNHLRIFTDSQFEEPGDLNKCDFVFYNKFLMGKKDNTFLKDLLFRGELKKISSRFANCGKRVIVVAIYDYEHRYPRLDNLILLRTSLRASKKRENEIPIPYLFDCRLEPFPTSDESALPKLGFCGWVSHRRKILSAFEKSKEVETNFIKRTRFWAGNPHDKNLIKAFYDNIRNNQFIIAQRGSGNFSMRFYETLAAGRIPVLVNTDMELPFESEIPWREFIVFENSERACVERVVECHRQGLVRQMQERCAEVFYSYLSPKTYFRQLAKQLRKQYLEKDQRYAA